MEKTALDWVAYVLVVIGALNWGLVGLFSLDLVQTLSFGLGWLATTLYVLVALSGLWVLYKLF